MTCAAGFLLASEWQGDWGRLVWTLTGTGLIIASACVFNNYLDRQIDAKMTRTQHRALVNQLVSKRNALLYGAILGIIGESLLLLFVNTLTAAIGLIGFLAYVGLYSFAKRRSVWGTLIGTISGSTPPVAGYTAVTGQLDATALGLFLLMLCWQMAHFYSIAIYRLKDYKAASLPVLPTVKGTSRTKFEIRIYILAFGIATIFLAAVSHLGGVFALILLATSVIWLQKSTWAGSDKQWGKRMFVFSLVVVMIMSMMLAVGPLLP